MPLDAGGRLTGRVGRYTIGLPQHPDRTTSAASARAVDQLHASLRLKRDILRRSSVGVIATNRSVGATGAAANRAYGLDGTFASSRTCRSTPTGRGRETDGARRGDDTSYRAQLDYPGDRYGVQVERLAVGDNFNPEVGFVRRDDMVRRLRAVPLQPAAAARAARVRKYISRASIEYIENGDGRARDRASATASSRIEFQNADRVRRRLHQRVRVSCRAPFRIGRGVTLPVGGYEFDTLRAATTWGSSGRCRPTCPLEYGTFYNGHKTTLSISRGRINARRRSCRSSRPTRSTGSTGAGRVHARTWPGRA